MGVSRSPRSNPTARIGELATLPVFFDLKGKPVLVAGTSDGAAWKAELLACCGAEVHLFAPLEEASEGICDLVAAGRVIHHDCGWEAADFSFFALAVGDCGEDDAAAFHDRARQAGIPVNVIDRPEFCQFKFGSIVNRSPLVIGISTDGAAPVLAQAVRRRIEAVLPAELKGWAELARTMRGRVNRLLASSMARRLFWDRFSEIAFRAAPDTGEAERLLLAVGRSGQAAAGGRVTIVGAGPGDAELLTLKAVRALQCADVILHDVAVPASVLELARREARREMAGEPFGGANLQDATVARMKALARSGRHVVRLVEGDGRSAVLPGGEIFHLESEGVSVAFIPGIAADAGLAPLSLPRSASPIHAMPKATAGAMSNKSSSTAHHPFR